jgi:hypothetical protein
MRRFSFFALVFLPMLLLGVGCLRSSAKKTPPATSAAASSVSQLPFESANAYLPSDAVPSQTPPDVAPAAQTVTTTPGEHASASKNVIVSSLINHQALLNPFVILGRGRAFENVISWRVRDSHRNILAQGTIMTNAKDVGEYGAFRVSAFYDKLPETNAGTVEVYTVSPKDGSDQDKVSIPVQFPMDRMAVKAYFPNTVKDPGATDCSRTYPVSRRIMKTQQTATAAILEVLKGPTAEEQVAGSRTAIIPGTVLRSVIVDSSGLATADFSRELAYGVAGSCNIQALVSEIASTLKQFPSVKSVKIEIEGADAQLNP